MLESIWIQNTKNTQEYNKLEKNIETEVCIIGAGIFGLSTAYYLTQKGINVTVVEAEKDIGLKTSGNTTGKITSQHGLFYDHLIKDFGEEYAQKYLNANEQAIKNIKKIIDQNNIECDFEWQDSYVYTTNEEELSQIQDEVNAVKKLGLNAEFVTQTQLPFKIKAAIKFPKQAQFDSRKYMLGLAKQVLEKKETYLRIHE